MTAKPIAAPAPWQPLRNRGTVQRLNQLAARITCGEPVLRVGPWEFPVVVANWGAGWFSGGQGNPLHRHSELQFEFCLAGQFEFATEHETRCLNPGDSVIILPGTLHHWTMLQDSVMFGLSVRLPLSDPRIAAAVARLGEHLLLEPIPPALQAQFRQWADDAWAPDAWDIAEQGWRFRHWLGAVLAARFRPVLQEGPAISGQPPPARGVCERAVAYIEANLGHGIGAADVARHEHISLRHLNRLFLRQHQRTVGGVLQHLRLEKAVQLMTETTLSIKEIASLTGFGSAALFATAFRKKYDLRPSLYRHRLAPHQP